MAEFLGVNYPFKLAMLENQLK